MSKVCELTGKRGQYGNTVSNANNKRRTKFFVNLNDKRYFVPELKRSVTVRLSNRAIRTVDKLGGILPAARKFNKTISTNLQRLIRKAS